MSKFYECDNIAVESVLFKDNIDAIAESFLNPVQEMNFAEFKKKAIAAAKEVARRLGEIINWILEKISDIKDWIVNRGQAKFHIDKLNFNYFGNNKLYEDILRKLVWWNGKNDVDDDEYINEVKELVDSVKPIKINKDFVASKLQAVVNKMEKDIESLRKQSALWQSLTGAAHKDEKESIRIHNNMIMLSGRFAAMIKIDLGKITNAIAGADVQDSGVNERIKKAVDDKNIAVVRSDLTGWAYFGQPSAFKTFYESSKYAIKELGSELFEPDDGNFEEYSKKGLNSSNYRKAASDLMDNFSRKKYDEVVKIGKAIFSV